MKWYICFKDLLEILCAAKYKMLLFLLADLTFVMLRLHDF